MARGVPLLWGLVLGLPCLALGVAFEAGLLDGPAGSALPFLVLGAFAVAGGAYVRRVAPASPDVNPIETFHSSYLPAYALALLSVAFLFAALYLLLGTETPYAYAGVAFVLFLVAFLRALVHYWRTSLTTYYVTREGIVSEYRFLGLTRTSFEHEDVTNVSRKQTVLDTLLGLGTVVVSVPSGTITMDRLDRPRRAEELLNDWRTR